MNRAADRRRTHSLGLAAVGLILASILGGPARAADHVASTPAPTARPPTCAERYPTDGPLGIDLMLGCIVNDLISGQGSGTEGTASAPRVSQWLGPLALGAAALGGAWLLIRTLFRRTGRQMAPVRPTAWWSCPDCRSLNPAGSMTCYACGRVWEEGLSEIHPDDEEFAQQAFGRRMDR